MTAADFKKSHLATFLFLLPFVTLLCVHDALGLSDAFLAGRTQRDLDSLNFNLVLMATFGLGVAGFVIHATTIAHRSKPWLYAKLVILAAGWIAMTLIR